jgi:hypothetical protein
MRVVWQNVPNNMKRGTPVVRIAKMNSPKKQDLLKNSKQKSNRLPPEMD